MKIVWRTILGFALFYFAVGVIGLLVDNEDSEDYKQSATFGGSIAALILAAKGAVALRDKPEENWQEPRFPAIPNDTKLAIHREAFLVAVLLERLASARRGQRLLPLF
jgi:hypothetical protein